MTELSTKPSTQAIQNILLALGTRGLKLAFAESITGGELCSSFVAVPGASKVVAGSIVAYDSQAKRGLLAVDSQAIDSQGVVSREVAKQMALGAQVSFANALELKDSQVVAVSTTGVAGPDLQDGKPVGTTFIGVVFGDEVILFEHLFSGTRNEIRTEVVAAAVAHLAALFVY